MLTLHLTWIAIKYSVAGFRHGSIVLYMKIVLLPLSLFNKRFKFKVYIKREIEIVNR